MRGLRIVLVSIMIGSALFVAGPAAASRPTEQYYFYDCTGDGPTDFWAVKTATPVGVSSSGAFALADGSMFIVLDFGAGFFSPPGIANSPAVTTYCQIDFNVGGNPVTTTVAGPFLTLP
jgi:hypothetical protein